MDGLSFDIDADMASVFVYLLGSDWKMRECRLCRPIALSPQVMSPQPKLRRPNIGENSWWVFGRNWFNLLTGIGVVCLRRRGTLIKCQLKQKVIIFFFEQRSLQLSIYLGRLNSEGGTSCFVKLYCGKRFLKTFFTDLINGQKQIRGTHVTRAVLSCWRLLDHASRVELNFVVLLNFDNVLEGPRSTRRNHHCDIGFSH